MIPMSNALKFLRSQKLMAIACHNGAEIWIANVYFGADEDGTIYFVSAKDTKHSKLISENPHVAFSVAWSDPTNASNRKGIQGVGVCKSTNNIIEITTGVKAIHESVPDMRKLITVDWVLNNAWDSKIWVLKPSFLKYWDDELYGKDESQEFAF